MSNANVLLDAVTADVVGTPQRFTSPVTIFIDGSLGGGSVMIEAAAGCGETTPNSSAPDTTLFQNVHTATSLERFNIFIKGVYWLRATLASSSGASATVKAN